MTTFGELYTALRETGATLTPEAAASRISGAKVMAEINTTYKYLNYPRIIFPQAIVNAYIASGIISPNGVDAGYKNGEEQIALNLYARQIRSCNTGFSFAISESADGLKTPITYTAPTSVTE